MKRPLISIYAGMILLVLASPSWARQQAVGSDALLSSVDRYRQEQALQNALEYNMTGYSTAWANPETGHNGRVTPTLTYKNSVEQDCRKYDRSLTIDGRAAVGRGTRCRTRNGIWVVPRLIYTHRDYYRRPYYPYYHRPYYPFTFHVGYYFGHFSGRRHRGSRHRGRRGHRR